MHYNIYQLRFREWYEKEYYMEHIFPNIRKNLKNIDDKN